MKHRSLIAILLTIAGLAACQKPEPYMTLSDKIFPVGEEGEVLTFSISANTYYRVNNDMNWAQLEITNTTGDKTEFKLDVSANASPEARSGRVRFIGDGVTPLYVQVNQAGKAPVGVSVTEINVGYTETKAEFTILGTKPWTASCNNSDFKLNYTSGNGETDIVVSFPENEASSVRTAVITVVIAGESYTVTINQGGAPSKERTDLSAAGTSNCYIVDKIGYYKFKANVRGTGIVPESCMAELAASIAPAKASVLWSTYNTATAPASNDAIITGVAVEGDYIVFNTTDLVNLVSGNVIIAAYDASNAIIWTWHIWLTETPSTSEIGGANWMDRNLGAINATRGDAGSIGLLYQWGRKDPMRSASTFTDGDFIATYPAPAGTEIEVAVSETTGTLMASIQNPRAFINTFPGGAGPKDWIYTADHLDRWNDTQKTALDPCPQGYRVPTSAQMQAFGAAGGLPTGSTKYSANADAKAAFKQADHVFETAAWSLPIAGYIAYNDGTVLADVNACAKYETSSKSPKAASSYYLNANTSACNFTNEATSGHAGALRCVKE